VEDLLALYVTGADRDKVDPILDVRVAEHVESLDEDAQVELKGRAKAFVRSYGFLAATLTYGHPPLERRSAFLNLLIPKLPARKRKTSKRVLEAIRQHRLEGRRP
jgi:type I restriction enzyme R subunit